MFCSPSSDVRDVHNPKPDSFSIHNTGNVRAFVLHPLTVDNFSYYWDEVSLLTHGELSIHDEQLGLITQSCLPKPWIL